MKAQIAACDNIFINLFYNGFVEKLSNDLHEVLWFTYNNESKTLEFDCEYQYENATYSLVVFHDNLNIKHYIRCTILDGFHAFIDEIYGKNINYTYDDVSCTFYFNIDLNLNTGRFNFDKLYEKF